VINKIDTEINYADEYNILGIVSTGSDYRLAHHINMALHIRFTKYEDFAFNSSGGKTRKYPWFYCFSEDLKIKLYLIGNHHHSNKLLPEFKQIDYFIILENNYDTQQLNEMVTALRKIKMVTAVFKLDMAKIKNPGHLIQKNELHEMEWVQKQQ
jgi:hypothetical protein